MKSALIAIAMLFPCHISAEIGEATTGNVTVDTLPEMITSDLAEQQIKLRQLMNRYTVTTNFGASTFSAKGLPKGVSINKKTGVISGKPIKLGTYTVTLSAQKKQGKKIIKVSVIKVFKVV
jgi:hypothetical protein